MIDTRGDTLFPPRRPLSRIHPLLVTLTNHKVRARPYQKLRKKNLPLRPTVASTEKRELTVTEKDSKLSAFRKMTTAGKNILSIVVIALLPRHGDARVVSPPLVLVYLSWTHPPRPTSLALLAYHNNSRILHNFTEGGIGRGKSTDSVQCPLGQVRHY